MAILTPSDVFVPEVLGDTVIEILYAKTDFLNSGYVADGRVSGGYDQGNTIKFPKFTADGDLGVQTLPTDASSVTADKVSMSYDSESVTGAIIAYEWTKATMEDAIRAGNVAGFLAEVVAKKYRIEIQRALLATAAATSLSYTEGGDGFVTYKGLLAAGIKNWGEYAWDEDPLTIMHSKVVFDLLNTDEAKRNLLFGGPGTVESGKIMRIAGKNIMALDSVPKTGSGASTVYTNIMLRKGGLSLFMKRELDYNQLPVRNGDAWDMWFTFRYATHLSKQKPYPAIAYGAKSTLDQA